MRGKAKPFLKKWMENCKIIMIPLGLFLTVVSVISYIAFKDSYVRFILAGSIVFLVFVAVVIFNLLQTRKNKIDKRGGIIAKTCLNELKKLYISGDKKRVMI